MHLMTERSIHLLFCLTRRVHLNLIMLATKNPVLGRVEVAHLGSGIMKQTETDVFCCSITCMLQSLAS